MCLKQYACLAALLLVCATLTGCQTPGKSPMITSSVTAELSPEAATGIAGDLAAHLVARIGPGSTTIRIVSEGTIFGQALEASLKGRGYAVVMGQMTETDAMVPLAYVIDNFDGRVLARLSMPSLDLTRMYDLAADGVEPISPLSVMQRGMETS